MSAPEIPSFPKVWALGHASLGQLSGPVRIEEKVDGSQFAFGVVNRELVMRSKGQAIYADGDGRASEKMFQKAVTTVLDFANQGMLPDETIFRCEYLSKPKHNALAYERVPLRNLIVYDVCPADETERYLIRHSRDEMAANLGLETTPVLWEGDYAGIDLTMLNGLLATPSVLGGMIEGVVIKAYHLFTRDGKAAMAKYVSPAYKEIQPVAWKGANPGHGDVLAAITAALATPRRWEKAVEALRDAGKLTGECKDIGGLIQHVKADVLAECEEEVKAQLWKWAKDQVVRGCTNGLAEWYKQKLAAAVLEGEGPETA